MNPLLCLWTKSVTSVEYAGSMMLPQGTYSGTVSVSDLDDHRGSVNFSVEIKGNDVAETLDFSAYRAVDFTVNQKGNSWFDGTCVRIQGRAENR